MPQRCLERFLLAACLIVLTAAPGFAQVDLGELPSQIGALRAKGNSCSVSAMTCNSTVRGSLSASDCTLDDGMFLDFWLFDGVAGTDVTVSLSSSQFDTVVAILDPALEGGDIDDDSGPGTSSRIDLTLYATGVWTIGVTSFFAGETGNYTLRLDCSTMGGGDVPAAPSNLTARPLSPSSVELTWNDNSDNETSFRVDQRTSGAFETAATVGADTTQTVIGGLDAGTTYTFRVRARNAAGGSAFSNEVQVTTLSSRPVEPCTPSGVDLCLGSGDRFRVTVDWRDQNGNTGSGQVVPAGTADSGLFWFFNPDNWEMLVKVLDGCAINNRFWVFFAATTDIEFTLRATDTDTGAVTSYFNPLGSPANAITDTSAFSTCP